MKKTVLLFFAMFVFVGLNAQVMLQNQTAYQNALKSKTVSPKQVVNQLISPNGTLYNTSSWEYDWDMENNKWVLISKDTTTLGKNKKPAQNTTLLYVQGNKSWLNFSRMTFKYDAKDSLVSMLGEDWNIKDSKWTPANQILLSYQTDMIITTTQSWSTAANNWVDFMKISITTKSNMEITDWAFYNDTTKKWVDFMRDTTTLSNKVETASVSWMWSETGKAWNGMSKETYTYDAKGRLTVTAKKMWDDDENDWMETGRTTYAYDANGRLTKEVDQMGMEGFWFDMSQITYSYYADGNAKEEIYQNGDMMGGWQNSSKTVYYWSQYLTAIPSLQSNSDFIIPNPYTYEMPIVYKATQPTNDLSLEVYNTLGSLVYKKDFNGSNSLNIDRTLNEGIYIIGIRNNDQLIHREKIVIKNQ